MKIAPVIVFGLVLAASSPWFPASAQIASPACCQPAAIDFPKVGGNLGNQSFSALRQLSPANLRQLGAVWTQELSMGEAAQFQQSSLVVVGGVLFIETTQGDVFAVDGKTGAIKWRYAPGYGPSLRRGVAVGEGKVFTTAAGKRVIALDQQSGKVVWEKVLDEPGINSQIKAPLTYFDGLLYVGSNDGPRGVAMAFKADTGEIAWKFYGIPGTGEFGNDTWEGDSWKLGGASPRMNPAIDPELGLLYWTFGNARRGVSGGGAGAVDGSDRGGQNLFANSLVALDLKTGKRLWHFQSIHHDIWDMDNVMAPVLADFPVKGRTRKAVIYGSKTGLTYILDRATGEPVVGVTETPVPQEPKQKTWPTQPYPDGDSIVPLCPDTKGTGANRAPPNYVVGCLFTPHTDRAVIMAPGTGGAADWSQQSFDPITGLLYIPAGIVNSAHSVPTAGVGFRPPGEERSGFIVAKNPANNRIVWRKAMPWALAHGNGILTTAGGLMFVGQPDGNLLGLDVNGGKELWRFQTGAGVHSTPVTYVIDGEQYLAVFAGGNGLPYNSPRGANLWAFKLGGALPQAKAPAPPPVRQPVVGATVSGATVANTVLLGRTWNTAKAQANDAESDTQVAMAPAILTVPVGTTVTFKNPEGNRSDHCAVQFFEGLFKIGPLKPGQSGRYTFRKKGEFFYNDCTNPQSTGKVVVQ